MARIVYGVSGEGSGHSSRAREVLTHLESRGHEIRVATYDRGVRNLAADFDVFPIEGLEIKSADNRVDVVGTFTENLKKLPDGWLSARDLKRELFKRFTPDVVLTDFEPMTAYLAHKESVPLVSIDNQHRMRYLKLDGPSGMDAERRLTKSIIRMMVPRPDLALVTTFVDGPTKNDRTFTFPPILRRAVLGLEPMQANNDAPILVYLTKGFDALLAMLPSLADERFLVYGTPRDETIGNQCFRPPSSDGFLADLASSKAVISTAGFTLMTEALHLAKPLLALPMRGQYEQELNAFLLDRSGYGRGVRRPTRDDLVSFLGQIPELTQRLEAYPRADNSRLFAFLDEMFADGGVRLPRSG